MLILVVETRERERKVEVEENKKTEIWGKMRGGENRREKRDEGKRRKVKEREKKPKR